MCYQPVIRTLPIFTRVLFRLEHLANKNHKPLTINLILNNTAILPAFQTSYVVTALILIGQNMGGTLFIVEDNPTMSDLISWRALEVGFTTVGSAEDYESTLGKLDTFNTDKRPDIIIMDILLPGTKDGIETAIEVQERYNIPIVYITSSMDDSIIERAKKTKPQGYILKPFTDSQLKATLEMALKNK